MTSKYDRQGNKLELMEWARLFEDKKYCRVAETILPDGKRVSTVWLGLDHQFGDGPPLIFETMIFSDDIEGDSDDLDMTRYSTEAEAITGHEAMVERWKETP